MGLGIRRRFRQWLIDRVKKDEGMLTSLIKSDEAREKLAANAEILNRVLLRPGVIHEIADERLLRGLLEDENARGMILRFLSEDRYQGEAIQALRVIENNGVRRKVLDKLLSGPLWQEPFSETLKTIVQDPRTRPLLAGDEALLIRLVQEALEREPFQAWVTAQTPVRLAVAERLAQSGIWDESNIEYLHRILRDRRTFDHIVQDEVLLEKILADDRSIVKTVQVQPVRTKLQVARAREIVAKLAYPLPTVVLSYPRAGSNFLQSVLQGSSGLRCQSIYAKFTEAPQYTLSVKSHSPSPAYLEDEWKRLLPRSDLPQKIIRLQRDPRDLMISFLEYTAVNRNTEIRQEEFLNGVDFFYASTIDREYRRACYKKGMSVAEAFKEHVRTWYVEPVPDRYEILPMRYEDLLLDAQTAFKKIFDFLNLDCELAEKFLQIKVSLYSDTGRQRARAQGWRENLERYGVLIAMVQEQLKDEIEILGYEKE